MRDEKVIKTLLWLSSVSIIIGIVIAFSPDLKANADPRLDKYKRGQIAIMLLTGEEVMVVQKWPEALRIRKKTSTQWGHMTISDDLVTVYPEEITPKANNIGKDSCPDTTEFVAP